MRLSWTAAPLPPGRPMPAGVVIRGLSEADGAELGWLMWSAFHGTPDDAWPTPLDAAADALGTLAGTWGPVVWDASLAAEIGSQLVAAAVVVRDDKHEYVPLLAFAMTDPAYQGRGIGQRLLEETIVRVAGNVAGSQNGWRPHAPRAYDVEEGLRRFSRDSGVSESIRSRSDVL
jgi:GNAT superfamily N-acetyltransferase